MLLKNEAARIITINYQLGDTVTSYDIYPGEHPAVEVPDEVAELDFVKALIANRSLVEMVAEKPAAKKVDK